MSQRNKNIRKKWSRAGRMAILTGCVLALMSSCKDAPAPGDPSSGGPAVGKPSVPNQPVASQVQASSFRYPLTGVGSEREVKERPVMVMVENAPQARPQSGLDQADLVYEILAEGEITRFLAVYQSKSPQVIGPVRSIRPYFVEIGAGLDALIVHAGWSQDAMNMIASQKLDHFDQVYGDDAYYWRSSERKAPHNLYTGIDKIRQGAVSKKFRSEWSGPQLTFAAASGAPSLSDRSAPSAPASKPIPIQSRPANKVTVSYLHGYNVSYQFDSASGLYKRYMEGAPHLDKETGKQLAGANILICESKHEVVDKEGRRQIDVTGPGKGYLVQAGTVQEVQWERKNGMIRGFAGDRELELIPGQTWVQIIPEGWGIQAE